MKLSVVIPTRGRAENLFNTVKALENQTIGKEDFEIIISDDNSDDNTQEVINMFKDQRNIKYVFSSVPKPHSWNASIPRNLGASVADPSSIAYVFVDSDVILPPHTLQTYINSLERNRNRVIIAPYDFYAKGNEQIATPDVRNDEFERRSPDELSYRATDGLACFGGNLVIPKDIFWRVGGFSPDTHIGLEDGDMGLKLWKKQTAFSYEKTTRGKHQWHETPVDRFPSNMKEHIDKLNIKHFHDTNPDYGIVEASREAYEQWGVTGWEVPEEWKQGQVDFGMKVNKI